MARDKEKAAAYKREWSARNAARIKEQRRKKWLEIREGCLVEARERYRNDPEYATKKKADAKRYREQNRQKCRATHDKWESANADKVKGYKTKWRQLHPDADRKYRQANAERIKQREREYYQAHKDRWREGYARALVNPKNAARRKKARAVYYQKNKNKWQKHREAVYSDDELYQKHRKRMNMSSKKYYQNNKDRVFAEMACRRANFYGTESDPVEVIAAIYRHAMTATKMQCHYCNALMVLGPRTRHLDHMTPLSRGGANTRENIVVCCPKCNQTKGPLTVSEFRERQQRIDKAKSRLRLR